MAGEKRWALLVAPLVVAAIGIFAMDGLPSAPASAQSDSDYASNVYLECPSLTITEGSDFRASVANNDHTNDGNNKQIKVYWQTVAGTADATDFEPLDRVAQESTTVEAQTLGAMSRVITTLEDGYSETAVETFTLRIENAHSSGGTDSCTVEINDDEGPGARRTWIDSSPGADRDSTDGSPSDTYLVGETITIKQQFTENVTVQSETVNLGLYIGKGSDSRRYVAYVSGSGTDILTFQYQVASRDRDINGIGVGDSDYGGSGSIITSANNTAVNSKYWGIPEAAGHKVQGQAYVTGIEVTSAPAYRNFYRANEPIDVTVRFGQAVRVDGNPKLGLRVDDFEDSRVEASYHSGSGTDALVFRYLVAPGEFDYDGISVYEGFVDSSGQVHGIAAGDAIKSVSGGHSILPTYAGLSSQSGHSVDGRPYVTGISVSSTPPDRSAYRDRIRIAVKYDPPVIVRGKPSIDIWVGDGTVGRQETAKYESGSLTDTLVFSYNVAKNDVDNDGISVVQRDSFSGSGDARIPNTDRLANTFIPGLDHQSAHPIDGVLPYVVSSGLTSTPPSDNLYRFGNTIEVTLTFDKAVDVLGRPTILLRPT